MGETIVFQNANIIDCTGKDPFTGTVVVSDNRIKNVGPVNQITTPRGATVFDLTGKSLLPGLIDAHTHIAIVDTRFFAQNVDYPGAIYPYAVAQNLKSTLHSGFTTIRDAGGCDWSFKLAVERGMIPGPRMFISCAFLSQTGGHGDFRERHDRDPHESYHSIMPTPAICDGVDQVRHAAREQLRTGADQIKIMAGGGAASPTDPLDATQFTLEEIAAAVYEAKVVKKPVMAHVYIPEGIKNCVDAGVRSIEHGNFLDEESAFMMKEKGMFLVPTLSAYDIMSRLGKEQGNSQVVIDKINYAKGAAPQGVELADSVGVSIASGADVFGVNADKKALEIVLKAEIIGPLKALISATRTNAELVGMGDDLGTIETSKVADLIVVNGDPLEDIGILQDEKSISIVMQEGKIVKNKTE